MCASGTGSGRRGAALVIVMLVMAVLLLAGTTFLTISSTESQIALNERASMQAFLLAEGGLQGAIALVNLDPTYTGSSGAIAAGSGQTVQFSVSNTDSLCPVGPAKQIVATGTVAVPGGQAQTQVLAVLDRISYPFRWAAFATIPNTAIAGFENELWLDDGAWAESYDSTVGVYNATSNRGRAGDVGANGDVTLDAGVQVLGSVRSGDALHAATGVEISGARPEALSPEIDSPGESFPIATPPITPTGSCSVGAWSTLSIPYSETPYTFYCTSFSMGNGARLLLASGASVTIYVTGNVALGDSVTLGSHPPTRLRIIAKSDGSWSTPSTFSAGSNLQFSGLLYARNTNITLGSGAVVHGSIIGRTVYVGLNGRIRHDQAALNEELCHGGKYTVRRGTWREVLQ
jgi:Tfp pilus assembly protein PilX